MAQFWCQTTARNCIITGNFNIFFRASRIQLHNPMNKFLIDRVLPAGKQQLKFIKIFLKIIYYFYKTIIRVTPHLFCLLFPGHGSKLI